MVYMFIPRILALLNKPYLNQDKVLDSSKLIRCQIPHFADFFWFTIELFIATYHIDMQI